MVIIGELKYMNILKKLLVFLAILVLASLLFSTGRRELSTSSNPEIIEIIDSNSQSYQDGYIEEEEYKHENTNVFVKIITFISNGVKKIIVAIFSFFGKIISSFAG